MDVNPLVCGKEDCAAGHSCGPVARKYLLLHYVLSGSGVFATQGRQYRVHHGEIFVIHPGELTRYKADMHTPWSYCWIGFEYTLTLPACLEGSVISAAHCGHIFKNVCVQNTGTFGQELYICGKIYELISLLCNEPTGTSCLAEKYVTRAKQYMQSSYTEEISVEKLARMLGLDRSYFCRIFKSIMGVSPSRYLVSLRLCHAAEFLAQQSGTPREAALYCGYHDVVNFSRMFKREFGMPPSLYGKNQLKTQ